MNNQIINEINKILSNLGVEIFNGYSIEDEQEYTFHKIPDNTSKEQIKVIMTLLNIKNELDGEDDFDMVA